MKTIDKRRKLYKLIEIAKRYPVIGARRFLGLDLPDYQQDMLERLWNNKYCILLCSRRTGKTFITAAMLALKAMLYPYMKVGIVAPVFRQAQTVFLEIEDLYKRSRFFRINCDGEPKHGNAEWYLDFLNGSRVMALPFSDHIRSKGFNIIFIDEYGYGENMNQMVKRIVSPMIFTKREAKIDNIDETDIGNQMIIASTATFKWNDYYDKVKEYEEEMEKGNDEYDIISYDYEDGLRSGIFEEKLVKNEYRNADPLTRQMEYLNIFPDETNGFITYEMLHNKCIDKAEEIDEESGEYHEPATKIEFEQELDKNGRPIDKYILAFDDADQGEDNFALALIKLDGSVKRLVRIETTNNAPIQDKIELIRRILKKFNVILIVGDQRHQNIKDNLAEPYEYPDGSKGAIIIDKDDEEQEKYIKNKYGTNVDYEKILKIHNFSAATNEQRARHFLSEIEKGRFKIPADPKGGYNSKEEERLYNEIKKTMNEITSIIPKAGGGKHTKYEPESRSQTKDRWTVCELGCFMADEFMKDSYGNSGSIVLGKWG